MSDFEVAVGIIIWFMLLNIGTHVVKTDDNRVDDQVPTAGEDDS